MKLWISVLVISVATLIVQRAAAQNTSTPAERSQWVEVTHQLESSPLDDSVNKQGYLGDRRDVPQFWKLRHKSEVILSRIGRRFFRPSSFSRSKWTHGRLFELSHEFAAA